MFLLWRWTVQILDIMHPGREVGVGIDLIWQYCESDIPAAGASNALCDGENINGHCLSVIEAREAYSQMVRIFILAILAFALCSCAEGVHLKGGDDRDNAGHGLVPGSGDPTC